MAALIIFLVTPWLNWPWHCMHVVYFTLWYEMIQASVRWHLCACNPSSYNCRPEISKMGRKLQKWAEPPKWGRVSSRKDFTIGSGFSQLFLTYISVMLRLRAQNRFRARLTRTWCWNEAGARVWNVSRLMWSSRRSATALRNAHLVKRMWQKQQLWVGWPTLALPLR